MGLCPKKEKRFQRKKHKKVSKSKIEWSDVGEEFKEAFYNLGRTLKEELKPKKKRR